MMRTGRRMISRGHAPSTIQNPQASAIQVTHILRIHQTKQAGMAEGSNGEPHISKLRPPHRDQHTTGIGNTNSSSRPGGFARKSGSCCTIVVVEMCMRVGVGIGVVTASSLSSASGSVPHDAAVDIVAIMARWSDATPAWDELESAVRPSAERALSAIRRTVSENTRAWRGRGGGGGQDNVSQGRCRCEDVDGSGRRKRRR